MSPSQTALPKKWKIVSLEDVAIWASGGTPPRSVERFFSGDVPWIKSGELGSKFIHETQERITAEGIAGSAAKMFPKGAVGIAMYGATIGKVSILGIAASANQACAVAVPTPEVLFNEYLYYYLCSQRRKFVEVGRGGAQPNISQHVLRRWPMPLPPLAEQHRIVAKIEELFSELDKGIENLKQARAQLTVYRQALLKHAFEGKLTADWREAHADQLESGDQILARIRSERETRYQTQLSGLKKANDSVQNKSQEPGLRQPVEPKSVTPLPKNSSDSELPKTWLEVAVGDILIGKPANGRSVKDRAGGFKVLRLTSLKDGAIDSSANKQGDWDEAEAKPYTLRKGDFLISRGNGSLRLVGRGGLVKDDQPIAYPDTMVRMVVDPLAFHCGLFCMLWNSEIFRQQVERAARTTAGIYKINQSLISNFRFPLIPLGEQVALFDVLESQMPELTRLESHIDANLQKTETLRQSILKQAFAGELVPQEPTDESASELLARMRAQNAAKFNCEGAALRQRRIKKTANGRATVR